MKLKNIIYLKQFLGEEAIKCLNGEEDKVEKLVEVLEKTNIRKILDSETLKDLCYKVVFGKYSIAFCYVLITFEKFMFGSIATTIYRLFIYDYILSAYNSEKEYREMFKKSGILKILTDFNLDIDYLNNLVEAEIENVKKNKTTIRDFLNSGGSLDELINILVDNQVSNFSLDTKIPVLLQTPNELKEFKVDTSTLGFLVSIMSSKNWNDDLKKELITAYYDGLKFCKSNDFSNTILTIVGKPNLYRYLANHGFLVENVSNKEVKLEKN